ncbi:hypothetical protein ACRAWD_27430 [Caulobacter segnis]
MGEWRSWYDYGNGALRATGARISSTTPTSSCGWVLPTEVGKRLCRGSQPVPVPASLDPGVPPAARKSMPPLERTWYEGQRTCTRPAGRFWRVRRRSQHPAPLGGLDRDQTPGAERGDLWRRHDFQGEVRTPRRWKFLGQTPRRSWRILPATPPSPSNHAANCLRGRHGPRDLPVAVRGGPLQGAMALGVIAQRVNGKLEFDPKTNRITNHKVADGLLSSVDPRQGWEQYYRL